MPILVDSDILIEVIRGRNISVETEWNKIVISKQEILISPASVAELWQGAWPNEIDYYKHYPMPEITFY